jgi:hypothetical protein
MKSRCEVTCQFDHHAWIRLAAQQIVNGLSLPDRREVFQQRKCRIVLLAQ